MRDAQGTLRPPICNLLSVPGDRQVTDAFHDIVLNPLRRDLVVRLEPLFHHGDHLVHVPFVGKGPRGCAMRILGQRVHLAGLEQKLDALYVPALSRCNQGGRPRR